MERSRATLKTLIAAAVLAVLTVCGAAVALAGCSQSYQGDGRICVVCVDDLNPNSPPIVTCR